MLKRRLLLLAFILVVTGVSACIFDPPKDNDDGDDDDDTTVVFDPLITPESVISNMEKAYNARKIQEYKRLLDENFVFFGAPGDVGDGIVPEQWDRATEELVNEGLLNKNNTGPYACQTIDMDIRMEDGISWTSSTAPNGETWYTTSLNYQFRFEISPDIFESLPNSRGDFTVRNAGTAEAPQWRLVEFRDWGR